MFWTPILNHLELLQKRRVLIAESSVDIRGDPTSPTTFTLKKIFVKYAKIFNSEMIQKFPLEILELHRRKLPIL